MPAAKPLRLFSGGVEADGGATWQARRELLRLWAADPWEFLTGRDVDGTPMIVTQDELDDARPLKAFPTDKPYLYALSRRLLRERRPGELGAMVSLVDKARQMMVSTLCMLLMYHTVLFRTARLCFLSKQTRELAEDMLEQKVRSVHRRTPGWFQQTLPLTMEPKDRATATHTGSSIVCVAQNAAARHFKGNTGSIVLIDEAAVQEYFEDMLEAARPMTNRIWAITTAFHGNPGADKFYELKMEA
jgi:hypothetical protein